MRLLKSLLRLCRTPKPSKRRRRNNLRSPQVLESRCLLTAPFAWTDYDQLLLELSNRARANPQAEAARFGIGLNDGLAPGELSPDARQPLAPVQALINAAQAHAADMLARDYFSHTTLGTSKNSAARAADHGYVGSVGENLSWGGSTTSIDRLQHVYDRHQSLFNSPGHRKNLLRSTYREVGISIQYGQFTSDRVYNASMAVEDFGDPNSSPYITGVVYADVTDNDFYDLGEAIRSGTISATNLATGQIIAGSIASSGGYALQVSSGNWSVEAIFSHGGFSIRSVQFVQVANLNVKLDFERFSTAAPNQLALSTSRSYLTERGAENAISLNISQAIPQDVPITVQLFSNAPDAIHLPDSVVIPAGQLSVSVTVQGAEDDRIETPQHIEITALVYGLGSTNTSVSVLDRTFPALPAVTQLTRSPRPLIAWTHVSNAASYEIWGDNLSTGQSRAAYQAGITSTSWTPDFDLALGNWRFYVRASAADGAPSYWSLPCDYQVRPLPISLSHGQKLFRSDATLHWTELAGATGWEVWIDGLNPRTSRVLHRKAISENSLKLPLLPIGRYMVWIRAGNLRNEYTAWSLPAIITITERASGLTTVGNQFLPDIQLAWNPIPGAAAWDIWMDDLTQRLSPVRQIYGIQATSVRVSGLTAAALRIWVRARDSAGGIHAWSSPFDVLQLLPPAVTSPSQITIGQPLTFSWNPLAGAVAYLLQLSDSQNAVLFTSQNITRTSFTIPLTLSAGRYRVWLTAVDSTNTRLQSDPFELQVTEIDEIFNQRSQTLSHFLALLPPLLHQDLNSAPNPLVANTSPSVSIATAHHDPLIHNALHKTAAAHNSRMLPASARTDLAGPPAPLQPAANAPVDLNGHHTKRDDKQKSHTTPLLSDPALLQTVFANWNALES